MFTVVLKNLLEKVKQFSAEEKAKVKEVLNKNTFKIETAHNGDFQTDDALGKER